MQHIIYEHYRFPFYAEWDIRVRRHLYIPGLHIIPVKSNIQPAITYLIVAGYLFHHFIYTVREKNAPGLDADDDGVLKGKMVLYQLVCQPLQRYVQLITFEQGLHKWLYFDSKINIRGLFYELVR